VSSSNSGCLIYSQTGGNRYKTNPSAPNHAPLQAMTLLRAFTKKVRKSRKSVSTPSPSSPQLNAAVMEPTSPSGTISSTNTQLSRLDPDNFSISSSIYDDKLHYSNYDDAEMSGLTKVSAEEYIKEFSDD